MKKILIVGLVSSIPLLGCSTSYKADGLMGGFSETMLAKDTFSVSFRGNGYTNISKTKDMAMLRGAELAYQNGYPYFLVLDRGTDTKHKDVEFLGGKVYTSSSSYGGQGSSYTTYNNPLTTTVSRHTSEFVIRGFTKSNAPDNALDTFLVIQNLKSKYNIK